MKSMTCDQLGGACQLKFEANTFEEMVEISKKHGMEMFQAKDADHLQAMQKMKDLMQTPGAVEKWFEGKRNEFNALQDI